MEEEFIGKQRSSRSPNDKVEAANYEGLLVLESSLPRIFEVTYLQADVGHEDDGESSICLMFCVLPLP